MRLTAFFYIGLFLIIGSTCVFSQRVSKNNLKIGDLDADSTLSVPDEFDYALDFMTKSWVIRRARTSNCVSSEDVPVSDSICKLRLSKMPCLMEMPYNSTVRSYVELFTVQRRRQMEYMLGMSEYYFPMFEQVLSAGNLPLELKYLSIIESALNTTVISRVGAAGLWQLMIGTGRLYGLEINSLVDERMSPVKATNAAIRYLKDLYSVYGDWHLVIAAYNCGPGHVNRAIRKAGGKRDYWAIYANLPRETRGYVPIFIAANYSMTYAAQHNLCAATVNMPTLTDTIMIHKRIHLAQIATILNMPIEEVRLLNAQYRKDIIPGDIKPYSLCLPQSYVNAFESKFNEIAAYKADSLVNNRRTEIEVPQAAPLSLGGSSKVIYHKVKRGQTLSDVADKYGVSVSKIKKWNHIRRSTIAIGQRLKIIK
jgi:membrane-bound lytic murein transglycosylase D